MKVSFNLEGADELDRALKELPAQLERKIIKSGIVAMGRHFVLEMRRKAPKKSGLLKSAKGIKSLSGGRKVQHIKIFAPHWHLVEFGTDHRFHRSGKYTGKVPEGKFSFIRPVLFTETDDAIKKFEVKVRFELEKVGKAIL